MEIILKPVESLLKHPISPVFSAGVQGTDSKIVWTWLLASVEVAIGKLAGTTNFFEYLCSQLLRQLNLSGQQHSTRRCQLEVSRHFSSTSHLLVAGQLAVSHNYGALYATTADVVLPPLSKATAAAVLDSLQGLLLSVLYPPCIFKHTECNQLTFLALIKQTAGLHHPSDPIVLFVPADLAQILPAASPSLLGVIRACSVLRTLQTRFQIPG